MTDPMTEAAGGQVAVTQEDRDAAADLYEDQLGDEWFIPKLRNGSQDKTAWVQSFARHRLTTRPTPSRDALVEALEPFATFADTFVDDDDGWTGTMKQERIVDWFGPSDFRRARQALAATIPADDGAGEAVKLAFTWAYARGFQVADETSRSCIGSIDDAWQDYLAALRPTGEEKP